MHPVDGAPVGAGSLWPVPLGFNTRERTLKCQTRQPTVYHLPGRIRHPGPVVVQARPVVDTNLPALVFGSGVVNSRVGGSIHWWSGWYWFTWGQNAPSPLYPHVAPPSRASLADPVPCSAWWTPPSSRRNESFQCALKQSTRIFGNLQRTIIRCTKIIEVANHFISDVFEVCSKNFSRIEEFLPRTYFSQTG
jgi:hypothetical protein